MIINQLLTRLQQIQNNRELLRKTCKLNQLPITILNGFTNTKIDLIYQRLLKHYEDHPEKARTIWFENQLKIFFWVVISISLLQNKRIRDFEDGQWLLIQNFFYKKQLYTFKYEAKKVLFSGRKNSRVWNAEQNKLLTKIMGDVTLKNKWNEVARIFYAESEHKYFRTGKQCREHWLNHLDPLKKHGQWTDQEDLQILKYVFQNGKKWSLIAKEIMTHRTQHMIKNRFKALLYREKKKSTTHQNDENKILRKIVRRLTQNMERPELQIEEFYGSNKPEPKIQTRTQIEGSEKIVEKSVHENIGETPLNNFNFPLHAPLFFFWAPSLQMFPHFNMLNQPTEQFVPESEIKVIEVNDKNFILSAPGSLKVRSIPSNETSFSFVGQNLCE